MSTNVYQMVTDRIIAELEKGQIPWKKPWNGVNTGAYNRISRKPYSLLNQMILGKPGEWATFKQWSQLGGTIRKGEKSSIVVFWKVLETEEKNKDGETVKKTIPMLKYINVFHISQVDGVEPLKTAVLTELEPIEAAEKLKEAYQTRENIEIREKVGNDAYYSPVMDYIQVPCKGQYTDISEYYSTLFHEMTHSTGHRTRLDRFGTSAGIAAFGSENYSKEELVAEIGSACILNTLGIETAESFRNSTAYIQNWLRVLKDDVRFIVSASSKAEKAVQYIMRAQEA